MQKKLVMAIVVGLVVPGCDTGQKKPDIGEKPRKSIYDLKQAEPKQSKEELEAARRAAGFKPIDEVRAEERAAAVAMYEKMERGFVKGRLNEYRALLKDLRRKLDSVEKTAPKWAKAKNPEKAYEKFGKRYNESARKFKASYNELTQRGQRGGDMQKTLDNAVSAWENLNNDLGPKVAEAENFEASLGDIRKKLDEVDQTLNDIEKDESVEPEAPAKKAKG